MEEASRVNEKLYEVISDIEPDPFRAELEAVVAGASLTPGVLTVRTTAAIDETVDLDRAYRRGAGVQLSYEGLKLTRRLARDEPWEEHGDLTEHDLDFLSAETLVSRGFYHLAHTGVASHAVEIVRRFGRNMTAEQQGETPSEPSLEVDFVMLAIEAGTDLVLPEIPPEIADYAESFAREIESVPLPDPETALRGVDEEIERIVAAREVAPADDAALDGHLTDPHSSAE